MEEHENTVQHRKLTFVDNFRFYFLTSPFIIAEGLLLIGFLFLFSFQFVNTAIGLLLISIGGLLIYRKVNRVRTANQAIQFGKQTKAFITSIIDTSREHNGRVIKDYEFTYLVNDKKYFYSHKSAYTRHLQVGIKYTIFYISENPNKAIIPIVYGIKRFETS